MTREDRILSHLPLVGSLASRVLTGARPEDRDEILSDGFFGLVQAADSYDPSKAEFSTWAWKRIRGAILDGARRRGAGHRGFRARKHQKPFAQRVAMPRIVPVPATDETLSWDVQKAVRQLPERDQAMLRHIYWDEQHITTSVPGLTRSGSVQAHKSALRRLREPLKAYWRAGSAAEGRQTSLAASA